MEQNLKDFKQALIENSELSGGFNELPRHPEESDSPQESNKDGNAPVSDRPMSIVEWAWETVGISPNSLDEGIVDSMWDQGADVVTTLLLSEQYRSCGYTARPGDILRSPSKKSQAASINVELHQGSPIDLVNDEVMDKDRRSGNNFHQIARTDSGIGA
jgi:hypothetical protein